jgi:hypothetical protein
MVGLAWLPKAAVGAACNWAELPPEAAEEIGLQIWSDAAGRHLWVAPNRSRAFVGTPESVEVWPRTTQRLGCA